MSLGSLQLIIDIETLWVYFIFHIHLSSQGTTAFNQVCKYDFNLFYFLFYAFYVFLCLLYIFYLFVADKGVSLAPTYSSIVVRKSDLRSSSRTKRWLSCFYLFLQDIFWPNKIRLRRWTIKRSFDFFERGGRHWVWPDWFVK